MRITIIAVGSRGDVQPYVALARGLQAAGHRALIATHETFEAFVRTYGLDFHPIAGNPREIVETDAGRDMQAAGRNPFRAFRAMRRAAEGFSEQHFQDTWDACRDADCILHSILGLVGADIGEKRGVPAMAAYLQPVTRTREFPCLVAPQWLRLGRSLNWMSHLMIEQAFWQTFRPAINQWRREFLGLPPTPLAGPAGRRLREGYPVLYGFSDAVVPRPADWGPPVHVTGYWFLDRPEGWTPPAELDAFLRAGSPPIYIGFGSMNNAALDAVRELALEAATRQDLRAVVSTGWGSRGQVRHNGDVIQVDDVPHDWLFPRTAAVMHHGGAGTTAAALRAGVPSIVAPFFGDQHFWAERVASLGAGPAPLRPGRASAAEVADAVAQAVGDERIGQSAAGMGRRLRAEDGVGRAVDAIVEHVEVKQA